MKRVNIKTRIYARRRKNHTGIYLQKGKRYNFWTDPKDRWLDMVIFTNADGFESFKIMEKEEKYRPMPKENWCTLIGAINSQYFKIGTALKNWRSPEDGELICFANDTRYWNNFGNILLSVEEIISSE